MECHNSNSSLDTVLISLDCEEEIKSEYSSLDTVILNNIEESKPKKAHRHYKSRTEHRCTRHNLRKKYSESNQAFVTQKIHVEKQDFQCIINLNTTICDHHENSRHTSCDAKSSKGPKNIYKRIVPHCLRQLCHQPRLLQTRFNRRHSKEHCTAASHQGRQINTVHECKKKLKHGNYRSGHSKHEKKLSQEKPNEPQPVSPSKKQLESEYEDISTTSLDSCLDIPISYKHVGNNYREYHESKLDTLIKRTKERERRLVEQSRKIPHWCTTSTPAYTEVSSEFPISCSEIDGSVHSRSTLILEPRDRGYSPSIEGLCRSPTIEKYLQYSPSSPIDSYYPNFSRKIDLGFEMKPEPAMDIGAYSPIQSLDLPELLKEQWIKKEVKIEPNFGNHET